MRHSGGPASPEHRFAGGASELEESHNDRRKPRLLANSNRVKDLLKVPDAIDQLFVWLSGRAKRFEESDQTVLLPLPQRDERVACSLRLAAVQLDRAP